MRLSQILRRTSKASKECQSGFTLVEVLVSALVLGISLSGSLLAMTKSNVYITEIQELSVASQAVTEEIEKIRDLPYASIAALEGTSSFSTTSMASLNNAVGTLIIDSPMGGGMGGGDDDDDDDEAFNSNVLDFFSVELAKVVALFEVSNVWADGDDEGDDDGEGDDVGEGDDEGDDDGEGDDECDDGDDEEDDCGGDGESNGASIKRVTAILTWDTPQGRSLSTSLSTFVTDTGINRQ